MCGCVTAKVITAEKASWAQTLKQPSGAFHWLAYTSTPLISAWAPVRGKTTTGSPHCCGLLPYIVWNTPSGIKSSSGDLMINDLVADFSTLSFQPYSMKIEIAKTDTTQ